MASRTSRKRRFCQHCQEYVSGRTYREHYDLYFNKSSAQWQTIDSSDEEGSRRHEAHFDVLDDESFQSTSRLANDEFHCYDEDAPKTAPEGNLRSNFKSSYKSKKRKERIKDFYSTKLKTINFQYTIIKLKTGQGASRVGSQARLVLISISKPLYFLTVKIKSKSLWF